MPLVVIDAGHGGNNPGGLMVDARRRTNQADINYKKLEEKYYKEK